MRVVLQRVSEADVTIDGEVTGAIENGLMILLGIEKGDAESDADWLANKLVQLRIFSDEDGKMNRSVLDIGGNMLIISQFTLSANYRKGNRPSFVQAARPEEAIPLYQYFLAEIEARMGRKPATGRFGADMKVRLINDGPVTIYMDSKKPE